MLVELVSRETKKKQGDETTYSIQGTGSTSFRLDSSTNLKITEIIYVLGIKKNLLSVLDFEDKGFRVTFRERPFYGTRIAL